MYEDVTYELVLGDLLDNITSDIDKREGSVIFDALAPCAFKIAEFYFHLDNMVNLVSGDTAPGEYLDKIVKDYGIERKQAITAERLIETTGAIEVGTRWGIQDLVYTVIEAVSENKYKAICDQEGDIGNQYSGDLENIDNVNVTATLTDIITAGVDEESDENLRARFYLYLQKPSTSGNADNYKQWALDVSGVGDAKVLPLWNGPGTVKVVIVDSDKNPATEALVIATSEYIETVRPIGANVTVVSAKVKNINITAKVNLANGFTIQAI